MTFNLDPEVGVRIAVDVALDDREVTVGARLERHRQLPGRGKFRSRNQREGVVGRRPGIGVDRTEIDPVPGANPRMVSPSAAAAVMNR